MPEIPRHKRTKKPNFMAEIVDHTQPCPPHPPDPPKVKPLTTSQQRKQDKEHAEWARTGGTVFRKGEIDLHRNGDDAWLLEYAHEYATNLTRADLTKLRDALNSELED